MIKKYIPDMGLIKNWTDSKKLERYPFMAIYEFDNKQLIYIGTAHNDKGTGTKSLDAINYAFDKFNIDFVVTEVKRHFKNIEEDVSTNLGKYNVNELAYSVYVAQQKSVPYVFADTNYADWVQDLDKISHNKAIQMQSFWILRDAYKYKKFYNKKDSIEHAVKNSKYKLSKLGYNSSLTIKDFMQCCKDWLGVVVTDDNVSDVLESFENFDYPDMDRNPNKIWAEIDLFSRDPNMIKEIFKAINKYNNVLVTMGTGHYESQRLVFEKAFGKPKYIYDFSKSQRIDMINNHKIINQSNSGYEK